MTIFGYTIVRNASLRTNPLSIISLVVMLASLYSALSDSGYFARYRFGDSITPKESQLVRSGPYLMEKLKVRNGSLISFVPVSTVAKYTQKSYQFDDESTIFGLVRQFQNQPVAYLWLYTGNPIRQIWKIDINRQTVLSYNRAIFLYSFEGHPESNLLEAMIFFLFFLLSMVSIDSLKPGTTVKQEKFVK